MAHSHYVGPKYFDGSLTATGSLADIVEVVLGDSYKTMTFTLRNTGGVNALTNFALLVKHHADEGDAWVTLLSGSEWGTVAGRLLSVKGAPHTLAHSSAAAVELRVSGLYAVKLQAASTSGTTCTVKGQMVFV
jgi:hypothetical protein